MPRRSIVDRLSSKNFRSIVDTSSSFREIASKLGLVSDRNAIIKIQARALREGIDLKALAHRRTDKAHQPHPERRTQFVAPPVSTQELRNLKLVGLTLYLGEGSKTGNMVVFTNSNPDLVKLFMSFVKKVYRVDPSKFKVLLQIKDVQRVEDCIQYWSQKLDLSSSCFYKTTVTPTKGSKDTKPEYKGTCHLYYPSAAFHRHILSECDALVRSYTKKSHK